MSVPGKAARVAQRDDPDESDRYYAGGGAVPKSFINGPLTVEFLPAPRDMKVGRRLVEKGREILRHSSYHAG